MGLLVLFSALATLAVLGVLVAFLIKQTVRVARAARDLSSAVGPVLREIEAEADRARSTSGSIAGKRPETGPSR